LFGQRAGVEGGKTDMAVEVLGWVCCGTVVITKGKEERGGVFFLLSLLSLLLF
jgi:hypothetical protein